MKHKLSEEHPLQPIRVQLAVELIRSTGLIEHCHLLPPRSATDAELELVPSTDSAQRDRASGVCTYNDAAVACQWLKNQGHRVAYVDVDVHHGDGVEDIFQGDPAVLTISLHESGHWLFPGTGFPQDAGAAKGAGAAANLPFMPYTWDEPWLEAFEKVVPALLRRFKPTVLVTQDGCDSQIGRAS